MANSQFVHGKTKPSLGPTGALTEWDQQKVFCNRPCRVKGVAVSNKGAAGFWLWICDSPTEGAQFPDWAPVFVPANSSWAVDWTLSPEEFKQGLYVCATTDPTTKTFPGSNDAFFHVSYALM